MLASPLLWYVPYGASLSRSRFLSLLEGARSPALPLADVRVRLPYEVFTSGMPCAWTGAPVFLDPGVPGSSYGRAYLITLEQFGDVLALENGYDVSPSSDLLSFQLDVAFRDGRCETGPGMYELLLPLGTLAGFPAVTFTASWSRAVETVPPLPETLLPVLEGLRDAWGLDELEALTYLSCPAPIPCRAS